MSVINKALYKNEENQKKAAQINWEIADCLRSFGKPMDRAFPLIPYLLYKARMDDSRSSMTLQSVIDGKISIKDEIKPLAKDILNDDIWKHLMEMTVNYSPEELALAVINPAIDNMVKGTMVTPDSILKLAHKLLNVESEEKVADVCCGSGTYSVFASLEEKNAFYHGYEIDEVNGTSAMMKADLMDTNIEISICDVFKVAEADEMPKYDKIFANYPFGLKLRNSGVGGAYFEKLSKKYPDLSKSTSSDWMFNALLEDMLKKNGKGIGIMTNGSTWNSVDIPMRRHFVERKMVECVIALPGKMFTGTNIPTTLIVLSHNNDSVRMIDATKHCRQGRRQNEFSDENINTIIDALGKDCEYSRSISVEELRKNEYILSLGHYVTEELKFNDGVVFESVIKSISRGAPCNAKQLDEMVSDSETNMQYLMLANIQNGMIDGKLPYLSYIEPKYDKYCLKNNNLILSKNGFPYKVAVASVQKEQRILANGNLYIINIDEEKANPYYIMSFFNSEQGMAVLKNITVGAVMPSIGVDKLKKIQIPLPPMETQERIAQKYKEALNEVAEIKLSLEKAVNDLHNIFGEEYENV